jgi:hypothetical protein
MIKANFNLMLSRKLAVKDGPALVTLGDALRMIVKIPQFPKLQPAWALVFMAVQRAAKTGTKTDIEVATGELELALRANNLLK